MKTYDMTHLAQYGAIKEPSFKDRLLNKLGIKSEGYMRELGMLMAATYNYKGGYQGGTNHGMPVSGFNLSMASIKLNFATIAAQRTTDAQTAFAAADILQLMEFPAGTWVIATFIQVTTAEGETATVDLGDGTDTDGYINDFDANAAGWGSSLITTAFSLATAGGKLYTATDTVDLLLNTAAFNVGALAVRAVLADVREYRTP